MTRNVASILGLGILGYLLWHSNDVWMAYDQFREIWGASRWVIGGEIPLTGGGAAISGFASPLTSWIYALALGIYFAEVSPLMFVNIIYLVSASLYLLIAKGTWEKLILVVSITGAYRMIMLRSGNDIPLLCGYSLIVLLLFQKHNWTVPSCKKNAFLSGLSIGLLPHFHVSGYFIAGAIGIRTFIEGSENKKAFVVFFLGAIIPLFFWLLPLEAVDGNRRTSFATGTGLLNNFAAVKAGTIAMDRHLLALLGDTFSVLAYPVRSIIFLWWIVALIRLIPLKGGIIYIVWILATTTIYLARTDYATTGHFFVLVSVLLAFSGGRQATCRKSLTIFTLIVIVIQLPLMVVLQQSVHRKGYYRMPLAMFMLVRQEVIQPEYLPMVELPTTRYRDRLWNERGSADPMYFFNSILNEDELTAFSTTGLLHLNDLNHTVRLNDYPGVRVETLDRRYMAALNSLDRIFDFESFEMPRWIMSGTLGNVSNLELDKMHPSNDVLCILADFPALMGCPACAQTLQRIPPDLRRDSIFTSCLQDRSYDTEVDRRRARIVAR